MPRLVEEFRLVQNSAIGAFLLWSFSKAYQQAHKHGDSVPLPFVFLVLPIVLHPGIATPIVSTLSASGLRIAIEKFGQGESGRDLLLEIHDRALRMRQFTSESVAIALHVGLVGLNLNQAKMIADSQIASPKSSGPVQRLERIAIRLGTWFAQLTSNEIATILKVAF
jgi:hypothetical protein